MTCSKMNVFLIIPLLIGLVIAASARNVASKHSANDITTGYRIYSNADIIGRRLRSERGKTFKQCNIVTGA